MARDVGIPPEYIDAIQGHSDGRATTSYGETTVRAMYREIQKLPRYDLDGLGRAVLEAERRDNPAPLSAGG